MNIKELVAIGTWADYEEPPEACKEDLSQSVPKVKVPHLELDVVVLVILAIRESSLEAHQQNEI